MIKINYEGLTLTEQLIQYCNWCLEDKVIDEYETYVSCKKHKKACQRFLDDLERAKDPNCPFYWDESELEKVVRFARHLKHTKGILAGQPIDLRSNGWQLFNIANIYAFINKKYKCRRFKRYFNEVGRKNGKSFLLSLMIGYDNSVLASRYGEKMEAYCAGVKRDQSKIVFSETVSQLKNSDFRLKFKFRQGEVEHIKTGSVFKPLSAQDGKKGDG